MTDFVLPFSSLSLSLYSLLLYFLMKSQGMLFTRRRLPQSEVCQVWNLIGDQKTGNRDFLVRTPRTNLCDQRRSARSVNLQCTNFTLNQTGVKLRWSILKNCISNVSSSLKNIVIFLIFLRWKIVYEKSFLGDNSSLFLYWCCYLAFLASYFTRASIIHIRTHWPTSR